MVGDCVVAGTTSDYIGSATAINCIGAGATRDDIGRRRTDDGYTLYRSQTAGINVLKTRNRRRIADCLVRLGQVHIGRIEQYERICARATVNRCFGPVIDDGIVACAGGNHIGATAAVNRIRTRT